MNRLVIIVSGKVQGVFFRASAKEAADRLGVKGFAQNQPDGSVYIEAEQVEEKLKQFVEWCKQGPPRAQVANVAVTEGEVRNFESFEIKR